MSDIVYLRVAGEQQGDISARCGTYASVGNRWQVSHEDEIFVFSLSNSLSGTGYGSNLQSLNFCKLLDRSSPLFINAINNNEQLFMEFEFYRISPFGRWEKYYFIQLRGAFVSSLHHAVATDTFNTETVSVGYDYILCKHLIANTEFSYLAFPEKYNRLYVPPTKVKSEKHLKTLNSKSVGRLLAAGGVYNENIEGFRNTAEKLGGDAIKGYDQVLNEKTSGSVIAIASILFAKSVRLEEYSEINTYLGKLRGQQKLLTDVKIKEINYIRRDPIETANLRKEFNQSARKNFLMHLAKTPDAVNRFNSAELLAISRGSVPLSYNVHHKLPLDDSGTNAFSNLVLIENEPYHKVFTNMQSSITRNLAPGENKLTPWAIPSDAIYPLKKK